MKSVKYLTKDLLKFINAEAIKSDRNRTLVPEAIDTLDESLKFPISFNVLHNDHEIRCHICLSADPPVMVWLDMPIETYNHLPSFEYE